MPIHDWNRVEAGLFHAFRQRWVCEICDLLNGGHLPPEYFALLERTESTTFGVRVAHETEAEIYAMRADRVGVHHVKRGRVALIDIVSPGHKVSPRAIRQYVSNRAAVIQQGIHLLLVDLFRPSEHDPGGIHKAIWDMLIEEDHEFSQDKPLTLVSYEAGSTIAAFVEPVAIGDKLPDMPLFLEEGRYVSIQLESSYMSSWSVFPSILKPLLDEPT